VGPQKRKRLISWVLGLFVVQFVVHGLFISDYWAINYSPSSKNGQILTDSVSADQIMLELFGFREFLSGILWVRADSFFDAGNYDAILPIIRLCTILDPKQIDIYSTGMWHIAYNFTDDEQRSDRRYIAPAIALGKEGSAANAGTYELFFETGWLWYNKIDDDYPQAVDWFQKAALRPDMQSGRRNLLAHAYVKENKVQEALDEFYKLYASADKEMKESDSAMGARQIEETIANNTDELLVRMVQRGYFAQQRGDYAGGDYDTKPPFEIGFSVKVTVEEPRVIRFEGTWNVLPVGTRIRAIVRDDEILDNNGQRIDEPGEMKWDTANTVNLEPAKDVTYMQEQLYVKNRRFDKRVDMSKDPTMYPFSTHSKRFAVEFYWNPRSAPENMKDKFGFNGEGMTDQHFLNTEVRPGQRVIYTKLYLTRDQIFRRGEWANKVPVVETFNYNDKAANSSDDRVIQLSPGLRGANGMSGGIHQ
jgi:hypothetical protein